MIDRRDISYTQGSFLSPVVAGKLLPTKPSIDVPSGTVVSRAAPRPQVRAPDPLREALSVIKFVFPPAGIISELPKGGEDVLAKVPQAFIESIFPPASLITGQLPGETMIKAEQERQIDAVPDFFATPDDKEEAKIEIDKLWNVGKPAILGGGTTITDVIAPDFTLPEFPDLLGGLGDLKKILLYGGLAIGGILVLKTIFGGRRK